MKKRLGYLLLSLFFCFVLTDNVYAEDIDFELKSMSDSNEVIKGNYVDVRVVFKAIRENVDVDYCSFDIETTDGLAFKEMQALNSWVISNNVNNDGLLNFTVKNNQSSLNGTFNIVNMRYVVSDDGYLKINSASCFDASNNIVEAGYSLEKFEITAIENTDKAILKSLKINNEELNPKFSSNVTSYNINNFKSNSLSLEYEVNDIMYQDQVVVTVNDQKVNYLNDIPYELLEGNKAMLISVTVGESTTYNIFVYKQLDTSMSGALSSITVNGEELELSSGKYDYVYTVPDDVKNVDIAAVISDTEKFEIGPSSNAPATFELNGKVTAIINVVAKDKQSGIPGVTYTITVANQSYSSEVGSNPQTSDTSMYLMALILVLSLVGSTVWYKKNLTAYK